MVAINLQQSSYKLLMIPIITSLWILIYILIYMLRKTKQQQIDLRRILDINNRILDSLHGFWMTVIGGFCYINYLFNQPNNQPITYAIMITLSYYIYDLLFVWYFGWLDLEVLFHHCLCILVFLSTVMQGYGGAILLGGLSLAEISSLPMEIRAIMRLYNLRHTLTYQLSQNLYIILYTIARGILAPILIIAPCYKNKHIPELVKYGCLGLLASSYYYIIQMMIIVHRKIIQYRQLRMSKIKYYWFTQNEQVIKLTFYKKEKKEKIF